MLTLHACRKEADFFCCQAISQSSCQIAHSIYITIKPWDENDISGIVLNFCLCILGCSLIHCSQWDFQGILLIPRVSSCSLGLRNVFLYHALFFCLPGSHREMSGSCLEKHSYFMFKVIAWRYWKVNRKQKCWKVRAAVPKPDKWHFSLAANSWHLESLLYLGDAILRG